LSLCLQRALYCVRAHGAVQRGYVSVNQAACGDGVLDGEKRASNRQSLGNKSSV